MIDTSRPGKAPIEDWYAKMIVKTSEIRAATGIAHRTTVRTFVSPDAEPPPNAAIGSPPCGAAAADVSPPRETLVTK